MEATPDRTPLRGEGIALRALDDKLASLLREEERLNETTARAHAAITEARRDLTVIAMEVREVQAAMATLRGDADV